MTVIIAALAFTAGFLTAKLVSAADHSLDNALNDNDFDVTEKDLSPKD